MREGPAGGSVTETAYECDRKTSKEEAISHNKYYTFVTDCDCAKT